MNRTSLLRLSLAVITLSLAVLATTARAVDPDASPEALAAFEGRYDHAGGARDHAGVHAAIDRVVAQMSFFVQEIARGQIRANVRPEPHLRIEVIDATHARLSFGDWTSPVLPTDGTVRDVIGPDGNATRFSVRHHAGRLYTRAETARGTRETWLSVDGRGRLVAQVRITAEALPAAIRYDLEYRLAAR